MKRFTTILFLAASWAYAQENPPERVQLKQRAIVMRALGDIVPIAVTNHTPFKARLGTVAARLHTNQGSALK